MWKSLAPKIIITKKEKRKDTLSVPGHHSTWEWEKEWCHVPGFNSLLPRQVALIYPGSFRLF